MKKRIQAVALTLALAAPARAQAPLPAAFEGIQLRLHTGHDSIVVSDWDAPESRVEPTYVVRRYPLGDGTGSLEVRQYHNGVEIGWLDYSGPTLDPGIDGVTLSVRLRDFARGFAVHRFQPYWSAPVFCSDYRNLPPQNQQLLWQQTGSKAYHLLLPLSGGGRVGELGCSAFRFRLAFWGGAPFPEGPVRIPLFAYGHGTDPYKLLRQTYSSAFEAVEPFGRPRWDKPYPPMLDYLGWCSWNAFYQQVTAARVAGALTEAHKRGVPFRFALVDDGWMKSHDNQLQAFEPDETTFPGGFAPLVEKLHGLGIRNVGVWHTAQGYWKGVDPDSAIGRSHKLLAANAHQWLPDPSDGSFFRDWHATLRSQGIAFVKVDNQAGIAHFVEGRVPLFAAGLGQQRQLQEGADFPVLNCMAMTAENAWNWRDSNICRNSDDFYPDIAQNPLEHVYQNAYNAFWTSSFAYPDYDMFETSHPGAKLHAMARAVSGGPVYVTDRGPNLRPEVLRPLTTRDGALLRLDEPGQVTRDLLFGDPALEPRALKIWGPVRRPGLQAVVVGAFAVNKAFDSVEGQLAAEDGEGLRGALIAYRWSDGTCHALEHPLRFHLSRGESDVFTLTPRTAGVTVLGLLDRYASPAAVVRVRRSGERVWVTLRDGGTLGVVCDRPLERATLNGKALPAGGYPLTRINVPRAGEVELTLSPSAEESPGADGS